MATIAPHEQLSVVLGTCETFGDRTFKMSGREQHCSIQSLPSGDHPRIMLKEETVFTLSTVKKQQLLAQDSAVSAQRNYRALQLIKELQGLDPSISEAFAPKSEAVADAPLRLLKPRTISLSADSFSRESQESFIALSYC